MDDFSNLFILCLLMFILTYIIGYLPMIFKLSETKLESISIFGAGFLLGTALIVIVPEGLSVLMETSGILQPNHDHEINTLPTSIEQEIYQQLSEDIDKNKNGKYSISIDNPNSGYTAQFVEIIFDSDSEESISITTGTVITPNKYPYSKFVIPNPKGTR